MFFYAPTHHVAFWKERPGEPADSRVALGNGLARMRRHLRSRLVSLENIELRTKDAVAALGVTVTIAGARQAGVRKVVRAGAGLARRVRAVAHAIA